MQHYKSGTVVEQKKAQQPLAHGALNDKLSVTLLSKQV
jgi:hypothetical protein